MILGIGSDLIDIARIERAIDRFGDRFLNRIFTETERRKSDRRANRGASYAKRYAAKEACSKALGTGFRAGIFWRDLGVVNLPSGRPSMVLTGGALARLEAMTPPGMVARIDLTITDEPPRADVAVFKWQKDNSTDYIKRVIGLPGDRIQMKEGRLYINGTMVKRERI